MAAIGWHCWGVQLNVPTSNGGVAARCNAWLSVHAYDLATGNERSPLFGAGNAGVVARDGRLFRRDDESRSESYAEILTRSGLSQIESRR